MPTPHKPDERIAVPSRMNEQQFSSLLRAIELLTAA
jgi:hypothetical protein